MALTLEWQQRVERWIKEFARHFYKELDEIPFEYFTTTEYLSNQEASKKSFTKAVEGTKWGEKWEYGWFRGTVVIPNDVEKEWIVMQLNPGGESVVLVDHTLVGSIDNQHKWISLTEKAKPGTTYEILLEAYAGHGPIVCNAGPIPPGVETVPETKPPQTTIGKSTFGIWYEDVYQCYIDAQTLYDIRNNLNPDSLRVAEIDEALRSFTLLVDFELPFDAMLKTIKKGREHLKPLLKCKNGSTAPRFFAFGHAHIDVAWLWPLAETERKCARTFSNQITLFEQYKDYKYVQSQPHLFNMVKHRYPELYEQVKKWVKKGNFIPEGGMWVEADTNITGGESLVRQFLYGKAFFKEEFDVDSQMLWLPDVFGYSGALPQIMCGCGIKYFSTAKIFWNYNGGDTFPLNTFIWEGIDGSEILVHICNDYNSVTNPKTLIQRWEERVQKDGIATRLVPFGYGDGGGGATRDHLEYIERCKNLEGVPCIEMTHPLEYYQDQEKRDIPDARYVGELYYQCHRGTYTSQAKTKRGNRKSEFALRELEFWCGIAMIQKQFPVPYATTYELWRGVLLNQFHDILPGSSINQVYVEAEQRYAEILKTASANTDQAANTFVDDSDALTIFNSLSWDRTVVIPLPEHFKGANDGTEQHIAVQETPAGRLAQVTVPSCGWISVYPDSAQIPTSTINVTSNAMENKYIKIELNEYGAITSCILKKSQDEFCSEPINVFKLYKDVPIRWDAWDIDSMYELTPMDLPEKATMRVLESGPLRGIIEIKRTINQSYCTQRVIMYTHTPRIDFETVIDWQESHKLLKVSFPVTIHSQEALHEIQFGHITRPNHRSRPFDFDRFEVSQQKWTALREEHRGFAVLNDCKYGINVRGNRMNLTLLKSALAPDMTADKGIQEFVYSIFPWEGSFYDSSLIQQAYEINTPITYSSGGTSSHSVFQLDCANILIDGVKPAHDESGDLILRLYESKRVRSTCNLTINLPVKKIEETTMLEQDGKSIPISDGSIRLQFKPFEIKTIRLYF